MTRRMPLLLGLLAATANPVLAGDGRSVELFDGKTLAGWSKVGGGATYRVEDGAIVGEVGPGFNTFLRTDKTFGDFRIEFDVRLDVPGNSGIQFRSHQKPGENGRVFGYQCEIDPSPRAWTAGIYDEGRRGWLFPLTGHPRAQKAFRLTGWNHFVIEARGPSLRTWLNGVPCADLIDTEDLEGFLALQVHAGKDGRIRWKNFAFEEFGFSTWKSLSDRPAKAFWQTPDGPRWEFAGDEVQGRSTTADVRHSHLFSATSHGDFALRFQVKPVRGDSGIYFHAEEGGKSGVKGLQVNIDPEKDSGGVYEIDGRGWVFRPRPEEVKKYVKPNAWNDVAIVASGDRLIVLFNGQKAADLHDAAVSKPGRFALQAHAGQDVNVAFKDFQLLVGPSQAAH